MNRRNFLSLIPVAFAGIALDQAIPFHRVWSFPKEIVVRKRDFLRDGFIANNGNFVSTYELATAECWYRDHSGNIYYWIANQTKPLKLSGPDLRFDSYSPPDQR